MAVNDGGDVARDWQAVISVSGKLNSIKKNLQASLDGETRAKGQGLI